VVVKAGGSFVYLLVYLYILFTCLFVCLHVTALITVVGEAGGIRIVALCGPQPLSRKRDGMVMV